ncbi:MAG: hypothetical protein U9M90_00140 [Patescibacteria group bacterium]|nr:hypothetical protein [Patescibacteria group bacterium]
MPSQSQKKYTAQFIMAGATVLLVVVALFLMIESGDIVFLKIIGELLAETWWIILPIPIWKIFMMVWDEYMLFKWVQGIKTVLLEIIPPADVEKSPKIMEQVFSGLHTWSTPNLFEIYCGWRVGQDKFSFEIASNEGRVHFYVRCPVITRNNIESQIYAQYPDTEIYEVDDYTNKVPRNLPNQDWDVWGTTLKLAQRDELPIRTYKNFIEDVTGKMIDPLASLTEVMSAFGAGQYGWLQIVFSPANEVLWHPSSEEYIEELIGRKKVAERKSLFSYLGEIGVIPGNIFRGIFAQDLAAPSDSSETTVEEEFNINRLSPDEQEKVKAVYNNISKVGFKTAIRYVYIGKRENFNKALGVAGVIGTIKQFSDVNLNALYPDPKSKTVANYYFVDSRKSYRQRRIMQDYRDRSFTMDTFIFNIEELATIFHFPDMSVKAPNLTRIEAKKGGAPQNLPIEFEPSS